MNATIHSTDSFARCYKNKLLIQTTVINYHLKDVLCRIGLSILNLRGQCYDGAANMSGIHRGLQRLVLEENRKALYLYCAGHNLNLVLQDACSAINPIAKALEHMNAIINFVRSSPKRLGIFKSFVLEDPDNNSTMTIRPLCPTRWVMRLPALEAFLENYGSLLNFMEATKEDMGQPRKTRSEAEIHLDTLKKFTTYFCCRVFHHILKIIHPIHVKCQGQKVMPFEVKKWIEFLTTTFADDASCEENARALYREVKLTSTNKLGIDLPKIPRSRIRSSLQSCETTEELIEQYYMNIYTDTVKAAGETLTKRYFSQNLNVANLLHRVLCDTKMSDAELNELGTFYEGDWKVVEIVGERRLWFARCERKGINPTLDELRKQMKEEPLMKEMFSNLHTALVIYICLPSSTCGAERSFSMLRRLKTYLRNSQGQERLNKLAILSSHRDKARLLELDDEMDEFISREQIRKNKYGVISQDFN